MTLKQILKTLYAPQKAFKEIVESPKYLGPVLILLMVVIANVAFAYVFTTKMIDEQSIPTGQQSDEWTQNPSLWTSTSNATINESNDSITGTYYGNASIIFSVVNATQVEAALNSIGPVNCSRPDEYDKLSFRVKWTSPQTQPASMTIKLFSNSSDYFSYSPTMDSFNLAYNMWNNLTDNLTIQLDTSDWIASNANATWERISGFEVDFEWNNYSNITLLVDGLFFHGPYRLLSDDASTLYMVNGAEVGFMQFVITWIVLAGLAYLLSKGFGGKLVWKPLLILIGFALVTILVQTVVYLIAYAAMPSIHRPFELLAGVEGEAQAAIDTINSETWAVAYVQYIMQIIGIVWTIALTALAIRVLAAISWFRSAAISVLAYFITMLVASLIGI